MTALENYFKPKRNFVYERYIFNSREQNPGESVDSFVTRLRKYKSSCEFWLLNAKFIRDRLVIGLLDKGTKIKLLGFVNYPTRFLPRLSEVVQVLRELTTKDAKGSKETSCQPPCSRILRLERRSYHTVWCQWEGTRNYHSAEREACGICIENTYWDTIWTNRKRMSHDRIFQRFNQYLARREKIIVESDHKPLQGIFKKSVLAAPCRLQRMLLRLQRYNLDVQYKPGSQMYLADHLSRAFPAKKNRMKNFKCLHWKSKPWTHLMHCRCQVKG